MMDLLNNFWIAISSPNEILIKILSVPLAFIESALTLYLIISLFNVDLKRKYKIYYIIISACLSLITMFFLESPFNIIFNYITSFIVVHYILKTNTLKTIIAAILPSFVFSIVQSLLFNPYMTLLNITYEEAINIVIYKLPFSLFMYIIIFIVSYIIKKKKLSLRILDNIDNKSKYMIIFNLLFGLTYIILEIMITMQFIDILPLTYTFSNFIMLLLYFGISLYSISKVVKLTKTTQELESAEQYNKTLHILHDNVRGFKHDFDNMVTTIGGYINTDDMEGLKKYYIELEKDCERVNNLYILNPDSINNPGIYNLLTSKYHEATEKGINVTVYYLLNLNELNMKIYEFARILGILLDNAIEAAENSNEKIINISFRRDNKNNRDVISIENSYSNKNVDTENIFNKGVSEKENHSGIGLWEVRKILSKNNNVNLFTSKTTDLFKQQLEIYL